MMYSQTIGVVLRQILSLIIDTEYELSSFHLLPILLSLKQGFLVDYIITYPTFTFVSKVR